MSAIVELIPATTSFSSSSSHVAKYDWHAAAFTSRRPGTGDQRRDEEAVSPLRPCQRRFAFGPAVGGRAGPLPSGPTAGPAPPR
ncbi:hypothetical protein [Frankia gtarii]|uniref:hypothetical protein n=1 Tax=Frankia gtarii TaxID=2950102 RepID=UPI0021C1E40C|nr:hypothetical protein [Frankia gtarii]